MMETIVEVVANQGVAVAMCVAFVLMMFQVVKNQKEDFEKQRQDNREREHAPCKATKRLAISCF